MKEAIQDFRNTIETASTRLLKISEEESARFPRPNKWSPKQIIGHLVDSAANNHQRFVRAQFKDDLVFIGYDQEEWVDIQHYQQESWPELIQLWKSFNLHIAHLAEHIPEEKLKKQCREHSLNKIAWKLLSPSEPARLEYMIVDYIGHMKNHLKSDFRDATSTHELTPRFIAVTHPDNHLKTVSTVFGAKRETVKTVERRGFHRFHRDESRC